MKSMLVKEIRVDEAATLLESSEVIGRWNKGGLLTHHLKTNAGEVVLIQGSDSFMLVS